MRRLPTRFVFTFTVSVWYINETGQFDQFFPNSDRKH